MSHPQTLTLDESNKLIEDLRTFAYPYNRYKLGHRNYLLALLMLDAGLRVGEAVQLRPDDAFFATMPRSPLAVPASITKTKTAREIPLSQRLKQALAEWHPFIWSESTQLYEPYLLPGRSISTHMSVRTAERVISEAADRSLGRAVHPHVLRHTFADRIRKSSDLRVVQQLLGHASITSTQVYTHPGADDRQTAIDSLNSEALNVTRPPEEHYRP